LYWYSRGFDEEPVTSRRLPKSIGCNKNFKGNESLSSREEIFEWLKQLCTEVEERLERDKETVLLIHEES
jgi:DNA polymerase eta